MTIIEAIILGVIQGATEFLPISSSGHLLLIPNIFNLDQPDLNGIAIAHLGTLVAVLVYFRTDLWAIFTAILSGLRIKQPMASLESRLGWFIIIGTIPAVVAGFFLADLIDTRLATPEIASFLLIVTALILVAGERSYSGVHGLEKISWLDSLIIGLAQAVALLPGISRSGITIAAGLGRGLTRETAARYSFLLGVPAIAGAGLLSLLDLVRSSEASSQSSELLVTFVTAAFIGYLCIHFLLSWLRRRSLYLFAAYCAVFGTLYLLLATIT